MTKKDFFRIIIKLFGLYFLIKIVFGTIANHISFAMYSPNLAGFLWLIGASIVTVALYVLLIRKVDLLIKWLKLDEGFDDEQIIFSKLNAENLLTLGMIIIGGLLFINNIGAFLANTLMAFKSNLPGINSTSLIKFTDARQYINWIIEAINIVIGFLLLTNSKRISHRIAKNNKFNE